MRFFKKPNLSNNWQCPICKKSTIKPVVLIPVDGTEDGNIIEAKQYHLDCIELYEYKFENKTFIMQEIE